MASGYLPGGGYLPAGGGGGVTGPSLGINADLNGFLPLTAGSEWNRRVDSDALDPNSTTLITDQMAGSYPVKAEFGAANYANAPQGIPYIIVPANQPLIGITLTRNGSDECDKGLPYEGKCPWPPNTPVENDGTTDTTADHHVIIVQQDLTATNGMGLIYEGYSDGSAGYPIYDGSGNVTTYTMFIHDARLGDKQRVWGITSADAAGLPIFPGLVKYPELTRAANAGGRSADVGHAFRFTLRLGWCLGKCIDPATHQSGYVTGSGVPFGTRVRLKSSWSTPSGWPDYMAVFVNTLKRYGMILADIGENWYVSGAPDSHWDDTLLLDSLRTLMHGSDFEVLAPISTPVATSPLSFVQFVPSWMPDFQVGVASTVNFHVLDGGDQVTWSISSGSLPPGLTLSSVGTVGGTRTTISGTPTTPGTYTFTVHAFSAVNSFIGNRTYTTTVH